MEKKFNVLCPAHGAPRKKSDRFFIGAIVCDNNRRGPIVG